MAHAAPAKGSLIVALVGLTLAGCHWLAAAPEARARDMLEALITDDGDRARAATLGNLANEGELGQLISSEAELALTYLRARARQGASIEVIIRTVDRTTADRRSVQLAVRVTDPVRGLELRSGPTDETRIDVVLAREANDRWRVRAIDAGS